MPMCSRLVIVLPLLTSASALPADLIGRASIIDGDTIEIHGTRIRLWGIDALESSQLCRRSRRHWIKVKDRTHPAMARVLDDLR